MRICNIPRVMSSPFSTMAGKQPAASKENRTLWNTNNTRTGRYHKIEHTHGWILNLSSRGSTLWSYFRQRPPLIQLVPWCSWVFARVLYLLLPLLLLLSLAERIGAVLRRCGDSSLRHRPSLTRARATERRYMLRVCQAPRTQTQNHKWIHPWFHADCSCHDQWRL